jgi:hypothetical protein
VHDGRCQQPDKDINVFDSKDVIGEIISGPKNMPVQFSQAIVLNYLTGLVS